jgi:uncharacterized protein (TIGR02246 family)
MHSRACLCNLASLSCLCLVLPTAQAEVVDESDPNVRAIRASSREYVAANRRGDLETLRKMLTSDGDYVDASGRAFKIRDMTQKPSAGSTPDTLFEELPSRGSMLRFITPDVAIEDGATDFGTTGDGNDVRGRFTAIWVKRDGRWLLDSLRESTSTLPQFNEKLKPLAWLLGEWVGTTDEAAILVSSHWSNDGNYIIREFLVRRDGRDDISATQRIGWDSSAGKIRCWTFDSQGGTSQGIWKRDGLRWLVDSSEVLADGKKSKSAVILTPGDDGTFVSEVKSDWDTAGAMAAGAKLATLRVEFTRAPEEELGGVSEVFPGTP